MKILHITNAYPIEKYSAYGIFIKEQIDSLNGLGFTNDVFFINAREKGKIEYLRCINKIREESSNYDLVHCHHEYSATSFLFSGSRKPYVLSILGDIVNRKRHLDKIMFNLHKIFSKRIIYKNNLQDRCRKLLYLPNGVNTDLFRPLDKNESKKNLNLPIYENYILFVTAGGIDNKIKRYDIFVKVVENLNNKGCNLTPLILSGVDRLNVPYYYNSSELMLMTSDHEGSPNAVKEAMACNLPLVSTDVGNVRVMLNNCNGSYVSSSNSIDELTRLCMTSLGSGNNNNNGRNIIFEQKLDINSVAERLRNLYLSTLKI